MKKQTARQAAKRSARFFQERHPLVTLYRAHLAGQRCERRRARAEHKTCQPISTVDKIHRRFASANLAIDRLPGARRTMPGREK
jgi:hypothetical protein